MIWVYPRIIIEYLEIYYYFSLLLLLCLICGLEIMCRLTRLATHKLWLSYSNLQIGRVATCKCSACNSQTCQLQTCKSHAHILEPLQIRSCVSRISKLLYGLCWFHNPKFKLSTQIQYTSYFIQVWSREFFRQEISN